MTMFEPDFRAARVRPSPNHGERLGCTAPDMIILHYTGMATGEAAEDRLCAPESQVSSHYLVYEDGAVVQMVREADRAWHAGKSFWAGINDINSHSVGIEIVNPGHALGYCDFPEPQIEAVIRLCRDIATRHGVAPVRILAHSDVAPGRKIDPGEKFPWSRLEAAGVGLAAPSGPLSEAKPCGPDLVLQTQQALAFWGYGIEPTGVEDEQTRVVVEAFQRHFMPARIDGRVDPAVLAVIQNLLGSRPPTQVS
ncbi:N-acetylmuramoyl-L-alanine amidase [Tianweitania sediminis]|uniref:N-acetylmuramoyl-L-alanine amidase n=1 Tax=Tianweitania sediminis TaxID=1502156 RepID=A0A8J7RIU0_9HYPH|nr:N-acetylmuramoyl-L-alanine amidase [Tianweitania sediminis]MBP0439211.1 N-acetylmuramoyl-L-alanine amidase [Tianweitania sediminis]